ncbi:hypothetical protein [Blastochloris tepida]|uniref:Uncharacterized protein n=1 Tax=Blastochloris tepida TaxID=2233851 RepID=A0A348FXX1_9HYPH|nr:hypothetical protein [Blastochloris tepida]BBF92154.1 hypothetical protein BLTE_08390 [Blastochloris tepida]
MEGGVFSKIKAAWAEARGEVALREAFDILYRYNNWPDENKLRFSFAFAILFDRYVADAGPIGGWAKEKIKYTHESLMTEAKRAYESEPISASAAALLSLYVEAHKLPGDAAIKLKINVLSFYTDVLKAFRSELYPHSEKERCQKYISDVAYYMQRMGLKLTPSGSKLVSMAAEESKATPDVKDPLHFALSAALLTLARFARQGIEQGNQEALRAAFEVAGAISCKIRELRAENCVDVEVVNELEGALDRMMGFRLAQVDAIKCIATDEIMASDPIAEIENAYIMCKCRNNVQR